MLQADDLITLAAGQYRLREPLAGSAYGVLWRARSPAGPEVALKLVNRAQMARAQPSLQERWSTSAGNEIAFLRALSPWDERHIVRLLDSGTHDGLPVMALELMQTDLARHIAAERDAGRPPHYAQVLVWMGQVNQALAKVHQYGWLYLDLKPANVLVDRHGAVKLADFGTSRPGSAAADANYAGTASWQAPEQFFASADGSYQTDTRSDYFALGAMFYYMVCGGLSLRFCSGCGQAYREHQSAAPSILLARHAGIPATLDEDEAALFMQRCSPAAGSGAALELLRMLLSPQRADRPSNALQISRMLARAA